MAKKSKVLRKGKNAPKDFAKEKSKVGKKKKAATNDTKTDYKVRQIAMPAQSALDEKGEEVTRRKLGLLELLAHMQHHSAKVRREAFEGLRELCETHPTVLQSNLARIVDATTTAPIDAYAEVRSAFMDYQAWLIGTVSRPTILSFSPTLALHVRAALSHVSGEVRADGLALLELYLRELGREQLFSRDEVEHLVSILCQLPSQMDAVLACLYQLLGLCGGPGGSGTSAAPEAAGGVVQVSLHTVLQGKLQSVENTVRGGRPGVAAPRSEAAKEAADVPDSPTWAYCLRAWLQAGELPFGNVSGGEMKAAARPGWLRLAAAAVLERLLQGALAGQPLDAALRPSAGQLAMLVGIVRRGEWPLRVDQRGMLRPLADAVNLRLASVFALIAVGNVASEPCRQHVARLASAAARFVGEFAPVVPVRGVTALADTDPHGLLLYGPSAVSHLLRTLSMLWACSTSVLPRRQEGGVVLETPKLQQMALLEPEDVGHVLAATAHLASGDALVHSAAELSESGVLSSACLLAVPLTASLLGLRPVAGLAAAVPGPLRGAWPEALAAAGEPSFEAFLEQVQPGCAEAWVLAWPRLLWYLGAADPPTSAFILNLLVEVAKKASQSGSLHEQLLGRACPLLVPFLGGRPAAGGETDSPPPLALLPDDHAGPQGAMATLLPHFPKLTEPFVKLIVRLICRWSDIGTAPDGERSLDRAPARLGDDCCQRLLEAVLAGRPAGAREPPAPLPVRLRAAASVLCALPRAAPLSPARAAAGERAALRLAATVADWIMQDCDLAVAASGTLGAARRASLALETLAWPLCQEVLRAAPTLGPRVLCFLWFCSLRLPDEQPERLSSADPLAPRLAARLSLLAALFAALAAAAPGGALRGRGAGGPDAGVGAPAALELPSLSAVLADEGKQLKRQPDVLARRRLCRIFIATWMRIAASISLSAGYELLAKLCTKEILRCASALEESEGSPKRRKLGAEAEAAASMDASAFGGADGSGSGRPAASPASVLVACGSLLQEVITYRNEHSLATDAWGELELSAAGVPSELAVASPAGLAAALAAPLKRLAREGLGGSGGGAAFDAAGLAAMLPLL